MADTKPSAFAARATYATGDKLPFVRSGDTTGSYITWDNAIAQISTELGSNGTLAFFSGTPVARQSYGATPLPSNAFSDLPISGSYDESEIEALRNMCEVLRAEVEVCRDALEAYNLLYYSV